MAAELQAPCSCIPYGAGGVASCLGMLGTRLMEELAINHIYYIIAAITLTPCVGGETGEMLIKGAMLIAEYRE